MRSFLLAFPFRRAAAQRGLNKQQVIRLGRREVGLHKRTFVKEHAQAPVVDFGVVGLLLQHLRRQVIQGTAQCFPSRTGAGID